MICEQCSLELKRDKSTDSEWKWEHENAAKEREDERRNKKIINCWKEIISAV